MLGIAMGFAISNKIPFVSGFSIFVTGRAWEFIRLICHDKLNVKIVVTHAGIVGEDGSTHNALEDLSLMATLPNLHVLVPADNHEFVQMLKTSLITNGPFYIRLPRGSLPKVHTEDYSFKLGLPDVLKEGKDICIIGTGTGTSLALDAANLIEKELDINVKVVNLSTIKPINEIALIKELKRVKAALIIEEHNIYCGIGSIIARIISKEVHIPLEFVGINEEFGESGPRSKLLEKIGLDPKNICLKVKTLLKR